MKTGNVELTTIELSNIAYAVGLIMSTKAPGKMNLHPVCGFTARLEIEPVRGVLTGEDVDNYGERGHSVWDQVIIDGEACGNRSGGQTTFMEKLVEFLLKRRV